MPSRDMLPFIQCHHTRGRALCGGFINPSFSTSVCAAAPIVIEASAVSMMFLFQFIVVMLLFVLVFRLITLSCVGGVAALVVMTIAHVVMTFALVEMTIALVEMTFALVVMTIALLEIAVAPVEIVVAPAALALYLYKVMVTGPKSPAGISMFLVFLLQGYEVHV